MPELDPDPENEILICLMRTKLDWTRSKLDWIQSKLDRIHIPVTQNLKFQFISKSITYFESRFKQVIVICTISCVPTGWKAGMVEFVEDAQTLREIQVRIPYTSLYQGLRIRAGFDQSWQISRGGIFGQHSVRSYYVK